MHFANRKQNKTKTETPLLPAFCFKQKKHLLLETAHEGKNYNKYLAFLWWRHSLNSFQSHNEF
jgi:hypothetical protein